MHYITKAGVKFISEGLEARVQRVFGGQDLHPEARAAIHHRRMEDQHHADGNLDKASVHKAKAKEHTNNLTTTKTYARNPDTMQRSLQYHINLEDGHPEHTHFNEHGQWRSTHQVTGEHEWTGQATSKKK